MVDHVEVITNESGDWVIARLNGKVIAEDDRVTSYFLRTVLHALHVDYSQKEITDEEMSKI